MGKSFRQLLLSLWEVLEVVVIAVATVFAIRTFLLQPFLVSGASMEPNFREGDYLFVDRLTYRVREPIRGETVVFRYPEEPSTFFIKRIIGLPGEVIRIENGTIWVSRGDEEQELGEVYLSPEYRGSGSFRTTLGTDEYFVMGDNRNASFDSRNWGSLPEENIIGIVRMRVFPFTAFGAVKAPHY